ncbi:hypothetical protein ACFUPZ_00070 [Microbacterium oxydans]|uniref:hypothetical protein n=1 Tax=Microbacterium oxydans TaxID=82380 RepID=UPI0036359C0B
MPTNDELLESLERANQALLDLAGEDVDAIEVKSVVTEEAPFLAKIVSKLSPMVGNLMEQRIVELLDKTSLDGYGWHRQDPGFPDAILRTEDGVSTDTGFEIKAWYVLSTEITGRFKESQNLLAGKNVNVAIVAWCMSHLIYGKPKILGVLTVSGAELAASRDNHYHKPPGYLIVEPQDTSARTANLQQSNVNGFKLQESDTNAAVLRAVREDYSKRFGTQPDPHTPTAQAEAVDLMNKLVYRLDTNFAKIDRVGNADVEAFKKKILAERYLGKSFAQWIKVFADLNGKDEPKRLVAEATIVQLYADMLKQEPKTELALDSVDAP